MAGVKGQRSGGHNAKTANEHALAGTKRRDRHAFASPDPPKGRPTPPKRLEGDALAEWDAMIADLEAAKTLATTDRMALYQYCRLYAETEAQAERASEYAEGIQTLEDNLSGLEGAELVACFQEIGKLHQLRAQNETKVRQGRMGLRIYLVEFGQTPASRGRVKLPEAPPTDPFDEFEEPNGVQ